MLLIDKPSAGLAPRLIERTFEHVDHVRRAGTAVLMVEGNVATALEVTDRAYALEVGENKFEAEADTIGNSQRVRDRYLGA